VERACLRSSRLIHVVIVASSGRRRVQRRRRRSVGILGAVRCGAVRCGAVRSGRRRPGRRRPGPRCARRRAPPTSGLSHVPAPWLPLGRRCDGRGPPAASAARACRGRRRHAPPARSPVPGVRAPGDGRRRGSWTPRSPSTAPRPDGGRTPGPPSGPHPARPGPRPPPCGPPLGGGAGLLQRRPRAERRARRPSPTRPAPPGAVRRPMAGAALVGALARLAPGAGVDQSAFAGRLAAADPEAAADLTAFLARTPDGRARAPTAARSRCGPRRPAVGPASRRFPTTARSTSTAGRRSASRVRRGGRRGLQPVCGCTRSPRLWRRACAGCATCGSDLPRREYRRSGSPCASRSPRTRPARPAAVQRLYPRLLIDRQRHRTARRGHRAGRRGQVQAACLAGPDPERRVVATGEPAAHPVRAYVQSGRDPPDLGTGDPQRRQAPGDPPMRPGRLRVRRRRGRRGRDLDA
jgi:hypothetical protein